MTDDARPPSSRRLQIRVMPIVFRIVNVPMRLILGLSTPTPIGKWLMLVYLGGNPSRSSFGGLVTPPWDRKFVAPQGVRREPPKYGHGREAASPR
jgi:hypothetical protein